MADSDGDDDRSGAALFSTQKSPPLLPRRTSPSAPAICPRAMVVRRRTPVRPPLLTIASNRVSQAQAAFRILDAAYVMRA